MKTILLACAILGLSFGAAAGDDKAPKGEKANWDGTYTITKGERDGKEIPAEKFKGSIIKFDGEKILGADKDKKEFFGSTFKVDSTSTPNKIMMVSISPTKGQKADGVIEFSKDTIKICYALPGGDTPTEFKAKEKQHYFELKRIAKDEK